MKSGELRHVVTIEQPSGDQSASGAITNTWSTVCTMRAKIEPRGGTEIFGAGVFNPESSHTITIRFWPDLTSSMRVNFKGRLFEILNINNYEERNIWMELQCREGRSHGIV